MPLQKDFKRLVRSRMLKTGESYTAARANLMRKRPPRSAAPVLPPATPDYAKLAGMSDAAIEAKTGRSWAGWVAALDGVGAHAWPHARIARCVHEQFQIGAWWGQSVTVGYERIKGLRAIGQRRDGSYEVNKSKTFAVPVTTLFDAWADASTRKRWLDASTVKVRTATRPKSIRLGWPDGTIVVVGFMPKGKGKSVVAVQHTKLPDKESSPRLKQYWSDQLDALGKALAR